MCVGSVFGHPVVSCCAVNVSCEINPRTMDESSDLEYEMDRDGEIDDRKHQKLVRSVLSLNKPKKPHQLTSRTEPTIHRSEFDLVTSIAGSKGGVEISDLTQALTGRKNRVKIKEKLKKATKVKTLPKPLEKPQAQRIQRVLGYEKSRLELDKWEPIVDANRASVNLSFPLDYDTKMDKKQEAMNCDRWRLKSKIEEELEKVLPKVEEYHIGLEEKEEEGVKLTMKEMIEKRKESARMRVRQGYLESKARQKKKIKSKKYHRILKRERMKQKLSEFEGLLKTDPEEALRQWDEKARIEERFTLRHKSTGKWARSKQFRAKYDKESRQDLAEQLKISKDLTKKTKSNESSDEDMEEDEEKGKPSPRVAQKIDESNPWEAGIKPTKDVEQFVTNYRKFYTEQNEKLAQNSEEKQLEAEEEKEGEEEVTQKKDEERQEKNGDDESSSKQVVKQKRKLESSEDETPKKEDEQVTKRKRKSKKIKKGAKKQEKLECGATSDWEVSISEKTGEDIVGEMFDKLENKLKKKKLKKAKKLLEQKSKQQKPAGTVSKKIEKKGLKVVRLASDLRNEIVRPVIDEALNEEINDEPTENGTTENAEALVKLLTVEAKEPTKQAVIDPNEFKKMIKSTKLTTSMPDVLTVGEDDEDPVDQSQLIAEALEDDDILDEFNQTKKDERDKDKPVVEDKAMEGWGSWTGPDIKPKPKRRKPQFKVKITRKDDHKGFLIINEKANDMGIKQHMVSDVPFPFKTVKDFEASIRAPITREFVTESAFKKFNKPAVTTKMGAIIEPMSKDVLMKK